MTRRVSAACALLMFFLPLGFVSPAAAVDCNGHVDTNDAASPTVTLRRDADSMAFVRTLGFLPCPADNADYWTINWLKGVKATIDVRVKSPAGENYDVALMLQDGSLVGTRYPAGAGGTERIVLHQPAGFASYAHVRVTPHAAADWSKTQPYVLRYNTNPY